MVAQGRRRNILLSVRFYYTMVNKDEYRPILDFGGNPDHVTLGSSLTYTYGYGYVGPNDNPLQCVYAAFV